MPVKVRPSRTPRCKTCKRRKVKCDYVRPACGPCSRSRIVCEGYGNAFVFVAQEFDASEQDGAADWRRRVTTMRSPRDTAEHNRDLFFGELCRHFLPSSASDSSQKELLWVADLPVLQRRFKPLDTAVNAFGVMLCARANGDMWLRMAGMRLYGDALRQITRFHASGPRHGAYWHEAALTSVILQYYETTDFVENSSSIGHLQGVMYLMNMSDANTIQDERFQATFLLLRITAVVQSILKDESVFSPPPWCFQAWGDILNDTLHGCLDVLIHVPGYLKLVRHLCDTTAADHAIAREIDSMHMRLDHSFETWLSDSLSSRIIPLYRFETVVHDGQDWLKRAIGYDVRFASLRDCLAMISYWVGKLLLFEGWESVNRHLGRHPGDMKLEVELIAASLFADNICLALRYVLSQEQGITGLHAATLPTRVVHRFYAAHGMTSRQEMCSRLIRDVTSRAFGAPFLTNALL